MGTAEELYQDIILDHNKSPRNFGTPDEDAYTHVADGDNPLCGDTFKVYLRVEDGIVEEVWFDGDGCAISTASTSVMTQTVKGKTVEEARERFEEFKGLVNGSLTEELDLEATFLEHGDMGAFAGLRKYPTRVKCGTLSWNTLKAAIEGRDETVTTE